MLNHLSAGAFQRFAFYQDRGPIVRVVSIQITYFLKSALGMAARWRGGLRRIQISSTLSQAILCVLNMGVVYGFSNVNRLENIYF
ncbi:hypothetical protein CDAR_190691 [Caerostris darwini]|uniref:Uncharacterized protein n=1 Tax=Caerostris darwini TaxID=1538125 RepID=A0AAV4SDN6_9ARAC|nr:hypothetical protein CDAR_190691 [Caerostris darwini]